MSDSTESTPATISTIDIREIPHAQRHPLIFRTYADLKPGEAFLLIVDHDPKPVFFQLDFMQNGKFEWHYLESGPQLWRIRVTKNR